MEGLEPPCQFPGAGLGSFHAGVPEDQADQLPLPCGTAETHPQGLPAAQAAPIGTGFVLRHGQVLGAQGRLPAQQGGEQGVAQRKGQVSEGGILGEGLPIPRPNRQELGDHLPPGGGEQLVRSRVDRPDVASQENADGAGNLGSDPVGEDMIAVSSVTTPLVPQGVEACRHPAWFEPAGQQVGLKHPPTGLSRLDHRRHAPGAETEGLLPFRVMLHHGALQSGRGNTLPGFPELLGQFRSP